MANSLRNRIDIKALFGAIENLTRMIEYHHGSTEPLKKHIPFVIENPETHYCEWCGKKFVGSHGEVWSNSGEIKLEHQMYICEQRFSIGSRIKSADKKY